MSASDRFYVLLPAGPGHGAFVIAETIDPDLDVSYTAAVVMPAASARLDPDFREAAAAWERDDHREYAAFELQADIESSVDDALAALQVEARERGDVDEAERLRRARSEGNLPGGSDA
jgi:hypothetical protein